MAAHGDTIFARATAPGIAGIAIIRISGPEADTVLETLSAVPLPAHRMAATRRLTGPQGLIDEALVLRFAEGASYTGEAMVELQCHGGRAVVAALLGAIATVPDCRMAEPGEFTLRAFQAGRINLAEAEALGALLAAETELQRRQAAAGLDGALQRLAEGWRDALLRAAALIEVTIDWADEEVPEDVSPEVAALLAEVRQGIARELALSVGAERLREGFEVALLGPPNAGKSSLFNALAGRDAAITSPEPGTTRDVLELRYDLNGLPVVFLDTAGMREATGAVESVGIARAEARAQRAAMRLFLEAPDVEAWPGVARFWREGDLRVRTKLDLGNSGEGLGVSVLRGVGLQDLLDRVEDSLLSRGALDGLAGHLRQRQALEEAIGTLELAEDRVRKNAAEEAAEDLRTAAVALERLLGKIGVEEVLGAVFSRFCLGK